MLSTVPVESPTPIVSPRTNGLSRTIESEAKPENIAITMGYVGQVAPNFGIDNMLLFMRGPDDGQLRVVPGAKVSNSGAKRAAGAGGKGQMTSGRRRVKHMSDNTG